MSWKRTATATASAALALAAALAALVTTPLAAQQTRAERSSYTETSTHADVVAFIDSLERVYPNTFVRGVSYQLLSKEGLQAVAPHAMTLAKVENLPGHLRSIEVRLGR